MSLDVEAMLRWLAQREGQPYLWGGRGDRVTWAPTNGMPPDPDGFWPSPYTGWDCFGAAACAALASGGPDLRGWWTDRAWLELVPVASPEPGILAFYAPERPRGPDDVEHVEVVVEPGRPLPAQWSAGTILLPGWRTIAARGGGSSTVTLEAARRQGACIKYRENHLLRPRLAGFRRLQLR